jgi:cytoskeletal protein RodZ
MTSSNPSRRVATRRSVGSHGGHGGSGVGGNGLSPVGEQLRGARERKGVDLHRVERDTKIRIKYLEALESGDFGDLPGEVYTRGFLRNYATYLGLDADDIVAEWRHEAGEPEPFLPRLVGPQPMTIRRGVVFQRSHAVILVVVLIVVAVGSYFGFQVTRFLQYPSLAVSDPSGQRSLVLPPGTTSYVLKGSATAGTTVLVSWDGQDPTTVTVDDSGHWTYTALLHLGDNQFDITAENLDTSHASGTSRVIITVPVVTPSPPAPEIAFVLPADGSSIKDGAVNVSGTSSMVTSVTLTPTYLGPPPAPGATIPPSTITPTPAVSSSPNASSAGSPGTSAGPSPSPAPTPATMKAAADGTFSASLQLNPGRWQLTIVGSDTSGHATAALSRTVVVPYKGLNIVILIDGAGGACPNYFVDGGAQKGGCSATGSTTTVTANKSFCINVPGRPDFVFLTVNGTALGSVSKFGGQRVYIDTTSGARKVSSC